MPVSSSDVDNWYKSASGASQGGAKSAVAIVDAVDENVFVDITDVAAAAGGTQQRKIFNANENGVDAYPAHAIWIETAPVRGTGYIALGFDDADDGLANLQPLTAFSAGAKVALVSDGADTRSVDVWGVVGGVPTKETVVMTGASEVLSVATFDSGKVYACHTTISASRTISIKQGSGGTVRGTIPVGAVLCTVWLAALSKAAGLRLPALATGQADGVWEKIDYAAGTLAEVGVDLPLRTEKI